MISIHMITVRFVQNHAGAAVFDPCAVRDDRDLATSDHVKLVVDVKVQILGTRPVSRPPEREKRHRKIVENRLHCFSSQLTLKLQFFENLYGDVPIRSLKI